MRSASPLPPPPMGSKTAAPLPAGAAPPGPTPPTQKRGRGGSRQGGGPPASRQGGSQPGADSLRFAKVLPQRVVGGDEAFEERFDVAVMLAEQAGGHAERGVPSAAFDRRQAAIGAAGAEQFNRVARAVDPREV